MLVVALIACGEDPADTAATSTAPSSHPYTTDTVEDVDVAAVQEAVQTSIKKLLRLHPAPVLDAYAAAQLYGGPSCPDESITTEDGTTTTHWQEVCTYPDADAVFNGPMTTWLWEDGYVAHQTLPAFDSLYQRFDAIRTLRWVGAGLNGQTDITAQGGEVDFNCSCLAISGQATGDDGTRYGFVAMDGPSHWSGPEAEDTWIQQDIQLTLSGYAERQSDGAQRIYLFGSATGLAEGYGAINFALPLGRNPDGGCHFIKVDNLDQPKISIRQSETGHWTDLVFETVSGEACTACTADSTFCLDFTPLLEWEDLPW